MVKWNSTSLTAALRETLDRRRGAALNALGAAVLASCTPYVPYRTGALCRSGKVLTGGIVSWTAPYAHDCYYAARPFSREKHPLATAGWFEAAKAVSLDEWRQAAARAIGAAGKDR